MVPVVISADSTVFCLAIVSCEELFPYQAVKLSVRMLCTAAELKASRTLGDLEFPQLSEVIQSLSGLCCYSVICVVNVKSLVICTLRY